MDELIPLSLKAQALPGKRNPALVYLSSLQPTGRRSMTSSLGKIAKLFGFDLRSMPWHKLRYEHVQAITTKLSETLTPATVNKGSCRNQGNHEGCMEIGASSALRTMQGFTMFVLSKGVVFLLADNFPMERYSLSSQRQPKIKALLGSETWQFLH